MNFLVPSFFVFLFLGIAWLFARSFINAGFVKKKSFISLGRIIWLLAGAFAALAAGAYAFRNFSFAAPLFLWLLPAVPVAVILRLSLESKIEPVINFNLPPADKKQKIKFPIKKYLCGVLTAAAVILLIIALARPRSIDKTILPPVSGVDIMLTVDTSSSMYRGDFIPDRITAAKTAAEEFVKKRSSDRIGIVVFSGTAMMQCPLTLDYEAVLDLLSEVHVGMVLPDGTAIGDALAVSVNHMRESAAKNKVIILLTDGASNAGAIAPKAAALAAEAYGIKVYTIATVGRNSTEELDEGLLREISQSTGGRFYRAYDAKELNLIYNNIDSLEKTEFSQGTVIDYQDKYFIFLFTALILLLLSYVLSKTFFMRIP